MGFLKPNSNDTRLKLQSTGAASATSRTRLESRQVFYKDAFKPNEGVKGTQVWLGCDWIFNSSNQLIAEYNKNLNLLWFGS